TVAVAQLDRASDCGSEGRGFESLQPPYRRCRHMIGVAIRDLRWLAFLAVLAIGATLQAQQPRDNAWAPITWEFTRLDSVGGQKTTLVGSPRVIEAPPGMAVEFDGRG